MYVTAQHVDVPASQRPERRSYGRWLVVVGIVVVSINLRPAVTSLGTVLGSVRTDLGMSGLLAGLLTALPVVCFAAFGAFAPALSRRLGMNRAVLLGLIAIAAGLAVRAVASGAGLFILASVLSLVGIAVGNVILPVLIKRHFPQRIGLMTGVYSTSMAIGTALPAAVTVPAAHATGFGWRGGLAMWAGVAAIAVVPWVLLLRQPATAADADEDGSEHVRSAGLRLTRSWTAWGLAGFFGMQSLSAYSLMGWLPQIYRDAGASPRLAGYLLAFATMLAIPIALVLPTAAARRRNQSPYVVALVSCGITGYLGLAIAPAAAPWLWALLLGLLNCAFPLALTMIGLRGRDAASVAQLSGFAQGVGYSVAAIGPLGVGALHQVTGGWRGPIALLLVCMVLELIAGLLAARDRHVEDEVGRRAPRRTLETRAVPHAVGPPTPRDTHTRVSWSPVGAPRRVPVPDSHPPGTARRRSAASLAAWSRPRPKYPDLGATPRGKRVGRHDQACTGPAADGDACRGR